MNKPLFHPIYIPHDNETVQRHFNWAQRNARLLGLVGQLFLVWAILRGVDMIRAGNETTYFGLIIAWACPFMLLLWYAFCTCCVWLLPLIGMLGLFQAVSCYAYRHLQS